jgi:hypothetical protein
LGLGVADAFTEGRDTAAWLEPAIGQRWLDSPRVTMLLVSLPFILIIALFRRERYSFAVTSMLTTVYCAWRDWGLFITP